MSRALRHAAIRSMSSKSRRIRTVAHKSAWLEEVKGYDTREINRRLVKYGFPNYIIQIRKLYRMHVGFVEKGASYGK